MLSQPIVILTSISLDANGDGTLPVNVPIAAVGRTVWIQALDQNVGLSNGLMEFIL
ncbi:MAG: hypothetical protein HQ519_10585 [Planctomycetes bacterium]|nr:hypothetical protein [Planctomycetota bacterium]